MMWMDVALNNIRHFSVQARPVLGHEGFGKDQTAGLEY